MVSVLVLLVSMAFAVTMRRGMNWRALAASLGLVLLASAIAVPVITGTYAQGRLSIAAQDWDARMTHWQEALRMMDGSWRTAVFGMGLGRFPETYFFTNLSRGVPASFKYVTEQDNTFLRLGSGKSVYIDQIVPVEPGQDYRLSFDARSAAADGVVNVLLCERTFFYSYGCESATVKLQEGASVWQHYESALPSGRLGGTPWYAKRPVKLSLEHAEGTAAFDVDNVRLVGPGGRNLVENGDFSRGNARWFFSSAGNHFPWHVLNLYVAIYFEQGWLGILAFGALVAYAMVKIARKSLRGDLYACVTLAALSGFIVVGWFESMFDAPRLILLFYLVIFVALLKARRTHAAPAAATAGGYVDSAAIAVREGGDDVAGEDVAAGGMPAAAIKPHRPPAGSAWKHGVVGIAVCSVMAWVITHAPIVPYNVRELPNPYHPVLAPIALAIFLYWSFAVPVWIANWLAGEGGRRWLYPVVVLMHSIGAWVILYFAVLPESIYDVVGSPVLDWPWEWEMMGRITALFGVLSLLLTGAALVSAMRWCGVRAGRAMFYWLATCTVMLPVMHWVVVTQAGTDNLTELMAGGGTAASSALLAAYLLIIGISGSLLGAWLGRACLSLRWLAMAGILAAQPLAYWVLVFGTADVIIHGGKVFSALQFLLSTDREHYAVGIDLIARYVVFHAGFVGALVLTQYPFWINVANGARRSSQLRRKSV